ncbi:MAG: NAD(P)/FAD-dependent oxidoreductase [Halioglobus sp.]|nr:NAD(P)/FAD-dependent oxidoreductase [Halioglobus sp.]
MTHSEQLASGVWAQEGRQPRIAIIGAGMSGIAAAVKLERAGYSDLTVFEKADRVGGTWRENTYPGLSCDIPSRWYCFTFALRADWSHRYPYGPEIQAYLESVAEKFGVTARTRFNTRVTELRYEQPLWRLTTDTGTQEHFDVVISATGVLHQPQYPAIEGLDTFAGVCFHSAHWDHDVDIDGKRVGVIGAGSTAAQIVGAVTDKVARMIVFQRTPQWMAPLAQKAYSPRWNALLERFPILQRLSYHFYLQLLVRTFGAATVGNKLMQRWVSRLCRKNLEENVPDPELRARLTPDYQAACKRLVVCSDFYPAISRPNARLVTEAIERIEPAGVRTRDGELHELDVLVLATGFDASAFILPTRVIGENGEDLESRWHGSPAPTARWPFRASPISGCWRAPPGPWATCP